MKIAVVGGGIGGLTAGLALTRAGYEVELYERASAITPIGAGISLWHNGVRVMMSLGVGDELEERAPAMSRLRYLAPDGTELCAIPLDALDEAAGHRAFPVARTDIQMLLLERLGRERVTLDARCVGVDQDPEGVTVRFADGQAKRADVLVGADGIRSAVREHVVGEPRRPRYAGNVNWNGLIEVSEGLDPGDAFAIVVGEHKRCGMMRVSGGRVYFFFDAPLPAEPVVERGGWRDELRRLFGGWEAPVGLLVERLDEERMVRQPICDLEPLDRFVRGRVALLGDAAHATTPTLGQGANQAMEDATVLTRCLLESAGGIPAALERYQAQRLDRTRRVILQSRARTDVMMGADPKATEAWYARLASDPGKDVVEAIAEFAVAGASA